MNIFVFVKQVPDTEARIRIDKSGTGIQTEDITFIDSPYDEYAVEQAILTAEANPGSTVTAVTVGPERAIALLRDEIAKGANDAVLIKTNNFGEYDALSTAKIIAAYLKDKKYDILFFGNKAYGSDNSLVPSMVAALAGIPQVNLVVKIKIQDNKVTAERQIEGMSEIVETTMPCLISAQKGLNEPRLKSLKGIMAAKKKEIPIITFDKLGIKEADLKKGINITKLTALPAKNKGKIVSGEEMAVKELVNYLQKEIKLV